MKEIIEKIKEEISEIDEEIKSRFYEQEEPLTGRFLGILGDRLQRLNDEKYEIDTKIYGSRGRGAEENIIGADFCIILKLKTKGRSYPKYFLSQAKKEIQKENLRFDKNLRRQCRKMKRYTSDSFIFVYTPKGIFVKSSLNEELLFKDLPSFFEDFFKCFIGDIHPIPFWPFYPLSAKISWNKKELSKYIHILEINIIEKIKDESTN